MVALKNKLGAVAAVGFLVAACTVTSTTTNPTDGGTSSSSSGSSGTSSSSGSSGTSSSSGSSGTSSGSSGTSGGTDAGTCPNPANITFTEPDGGTTCDTCAHAQCQAEIDGCFKDTTPAACDCRSLEACVQSCAQGDQTCVQDCINVHPTGLPLGNTWRNCVFGVKCGPADAGGNGSCQ